MSLLPANKIRAHRNRLVFPSFLLTWLLTCLLRLLIWSRVVMFLIHTFTDCVVYSDAYISHHVYWERVVIVCQWRAGARRMNSAKIKLLVSFFLLQFTVSSSSAGLNWFISEEISYTVTWLQYPDKHETFICCNLSVKTTVLALIIAVLYNYFSWTLYIIRLNPVVFHCYTGFLFDLLFCHTIKMCWTVYSVFTRTYWETLPFTVSDDLAVFQNPVSCLPRQHFLGLHNKQKCCCLRTPIEKKTNKLSLISRLFRSDNEANWRANKLLHFAANYHKTKLPELLSTFILCLISYCMSTV